VRLFIPRLFTILVGVYCGDLGQKSARDMLMSGFVYLALGILWRMQGRPARWSDYTALGILLGVGFLAKAPLLPLGLFVLSGHSLPFLRTGVRRLRWRLWPSQYYSQLAVVYIMFPCPARGHFTLGESGAFNYLIYVNRARPMWYLQSPGTGHGWFVHSPEKIFSSPPADAFPGTSVVNPPASL
jgi:hypothetical protein